MRGNKVGRVTGRSGLLPQLPSKKPTPSPGRNLPVAIGVGVLLGAIVITALLIGPRAWYPLVALASGLATWEVCTRLREHSVVLPRRAMIVLSQLIVWPTWQFHEKGLAVGFALSTLALMFIRLFHHGSHQAPKNYVRDTAIGFFVLVWVPVFASFAAMLSLVEGKNVGGSAVIAAFMLCVVASDTGGYFTGVLFGAHPMAPHISPKKSWEGFVGSLIGGNLVGVIVAFYLLSERWWFGLLLGSALVVCATCGDLVESQFKRELGIKDMSGMLPGHGGLMDRLDGMLPSAAMSWVVFTVLFG